MYLSHTEAFLPPLKKKQTKKDNGSLYKDFKPYFLIRFVFWNDLIGQRKTTKTVLKCMNFPIQISEQFVLNLDLILMSFVI